MWHRARGIAAECDDQARKDRWLTPRCSTQPVRIPSVPPFPAEREGRAAPDVDELRSPRRWAARRSLRSWARRRRAPGKYRKTDDDGSPCAQGCCAHVLVREARRGTPAPNDDRPSAGAQSPPTALLHPRKAAVTRPLSGAASPPRFGRGGALAAAPGGRRRHGDVSAAGPPASFHMVGTHRGPPGSTSHGPGTQRQVP